MTTQLIDPIPKIDRKWIGLTPFEAAKQRTPEKKIRGIKCCAALRQILAGEREAPDYNKTVLGA
ncbi:hypothetical protein [Agarivorans sp. QJM3NY_25]|uniref:hypothetical protein n=1 Tax=Agarivorans sp. QJM3NY_25 TaxID=3421430 RepID=UPI003D7D4108